MKLLLTHTKTTSHPSERCPPIWNRWSGCARATSLRRGRHHRPSRPSLVRAAPLFPHAAIPILCAGRGSILRSSVYYSWNVLTAGAPGRMPHLSACTSLSWGGGGGLSHCIPVMAYFSFSRLYSFTWPGFHSRGRWPRRVAGITCFSTATPDLPTVVFSIFHDMGLPSQTPQNSKWLRLYSFLWPHFHSGTMAAESRGCDMFFNCDLTSQPWSPPSPRT